jgi:hypothetical protein
MVVAKDSFSYSWDDFQGSGSIEAKVHTQPGIGVSIRVINNKRFKK